MVWAVEGRFQSRKRVSSSVRKRSQLSGESFVGTGRISQDLSGLEADTGSSANSFVRFHSFDDSFV